jgi:hypothetical protein
MAGVAGCIQQYQTVFLYPLWQSLFPQRSKKQGIFLPEPGTAESFAVPIKDEFPFIFCFYFWLVWRIVDLYHSNKKLLTFSDAEIRYWLFVTGQPTNNGNT